MSNLDENDQKFLRRKEAAAFVRERFGLPCQPTTLSKLATVGGGPVYRKMGRIPLYRPSDLAAWAATRVGRPMRSSSVAA